MNDDVEAVSATDGGDSSSSSSSILFWSDMQFQSIRMAASSSSIASMPSSPSSLRVTDEFTDVEWNALVTITSHADMLVIESLTRVHIRGLLEVDEGDGSDGVCLGSFPG